MTGGHESDGPRELSELLRSVPEERLAQLAPDAFGDAVRRWYTADAAGQQAGTRTPRWVSAV